MYYKHNLLSIIKSYNLPNPPHFIFPFILGIICNKIYYEIDKLNKK